MLTRKVALCHVVTFFLSQIVMLGGDFCSMKFFFLTDTVVLLNTKHLFLKQVLANMLIWENK